jgi:hypothetical protein
VEEDAVSMTTSRAGVGRTLQNLKRAARPKRLAG